MEIILSIFTALLISYLSIPSYLKIAKLKHLFDDPTESRKVHTDNIPSMGGVLIIFSTIIACLTWFPSLQIDHFRYIFPCLLILILIGIKDDIIGMAPKIKLCFQVFVALVIVVFADLRITSFYGMFGLYEINYLSSITISIFTIIVVINSYNLIDGIDGLAGGIGCIVSICFGTWLYFVGDYIYATLAFALTGGLLGFLIFNFAPARLFMGDSGSLSIGFIIGILSFRVIESDISVITANLPLIFKPIFTISILLYPMFDTLRVFIIRTYKGISPFKADRNHIHHLFLDKGFSHKQTSLILYTVNILVGLFFCITIQMI